MLGNIISNGYESMSVFCDTTIRKYVWTIFGYKGITLDQIQPCSVDLRLDKKLKKITGETYNLEDEPYILQPNEFILGSTVETVDLPNNILARVEGRSSLGRLGIMIHVTAFQSYYSLIFIKDSPSLFCSLRNFNPIIVLFSSLANSVQV